MEQFVRSFSRMKILSITCLLLLMASLLIISEGKAILKDNNNVDKKLESLLVSMRRSSNDENDRKKNHRQNVSQSKFSMKLRALKIDFFLRFTALWRTMNDWNNWKKSWNCSTYLCNVDLDPRVCFFRFFEHLKAAAIAATLKIVQMYFNYMVDDLDLHQKSLFLRWCTSFKRSLWKNIMKKFAKYLV